MRKAIATIILGAVSLGIVAQSAAAQSPSDREVAAAGVFQANDFPAGWRAMPPQGKERDLSRLGGPQGPGSCPVVKKAEGDVRKNRTAQVQSDHFAGPEEVYLSFVAVYRTEEVSRRVFRALDADAFVRCAMRRIKDAENKRAEASDLGVKVEGGTVTGTGVYGYESSGMSFTITESNGARSQKGFADYVSMRVGRSIGFYLRAATSEASAFDMPTFDGLITAAAERLTIATGQKRPRGAVRVAVYNAVGVGSDAHANMSNHLRTLGYQLAAVGFTTPRTGTAVQCQQGFEKEAARLQGDVGAGTTVEPFASPALPGTEIVNCIVLLGQ